MCEDGGSGHQVVGKGVLARVSVGKKGPIILGRFLFRVDVERITLCRVILTLRGDLDTC